MVTSVTCTLDFPGNSYICELGVVFQDFAHQSASILKSITIRESLYGLVTYVLYERVISILCAKQSRRTGRVINYLWGGGGRHSHIFS